MIAILESIKKDFKILFRSKINTFILIITPLLLIFLIGFAYNSPETYRLNIGVYSEDSNNFTSDIINGMKDSTFNIILYENQESCIQNIKKGIQNACVIFPQNMSLGKKQNNVKILVDSSKTNVVWIVKDIVENKIKKKSNEISQELTNNIIQKINSVENQSISMKKTFSNLASEINQIQDKQKEVSNNLNKLETNFNLKEFEINDTKSKASTASKNVNNLKINTKRIITIIEDSFDDLDSKAELLGNSSGAQELKKTLTETRKQLNIVATQIKSSSELSSNSISKMDGLITNISSKLEKVNVNFKNNKEVKVSSDKILTQIKNIGESSNNEVSGIQKNNQEIIENFAKIKIRQPKEISQPIGVEVNSITPSKSHMSVIFPQFLAIILIFISLLIPTIMRVHDKSSRAFVRQKLSPVFTSTFLLGTYITNLIVIILQFLIMVGIAKYGLNLNIFHNFWSLLFSVIIISSAFIMLGIFIGQLFKEEQSATIASISLLALFLFFSGIIIPLESLPIALLKINYYNPFVMGISLIRSNIFFSSPIINMIKSYLVLILYTAILYLLALLLTDFQKQD